jgi:Uma2 family endonuclease
LVTSDALLLAIEVSDSSLRDDLGAKRLSYAKAGVPHYWVVDINAAQTHVFGEPLKGDYGSHDIVPFGKLIAVPGGNRKVRIG